MTKIIFITGASGVGKTSLLNDFSKKHPEKICIHFDSIKVPSMETMIKEFGSPSEWQKAKTLEWVKRICKQYATQEVYFEGQMNIDFILDAVKNHKIKDYKIILIHCDEKAMKTRLKKRGQEELFSQDMRNWLNFLHRQAKEKNITVIDTSTLTEAQKLAEFLKVIPY